PESARNVTIRPLSTVTASSVVPVSFTNGRFVARALLTSVHGISFVQLALSVPAGSTYATIASSPQEPSGKQAREAHSACAAQARHVRSWSHAGVAPLHSLACSGVHCTHVIEPATSHTAAGALHSALLVHRAGPASASWQLSFGFAPGQWFELEVHGQPAANTSARTEAKSEARRATMSGS